MGVDGFGQGVAQAVVKSVAWSPVVSAPPGLTWDPREGSHRADQGQVGTWLNDVLSICSGTDGSG
jgi:hypothetical protein